MKKILSFIFLFITISQNVISQVIAPSETLEYCPATNYSFTASGLSGTVTNVYPYLSNAEVLIGSPVYNGGSVTFVARFGDFNEKQTMRIEYKDANNATKFHDFDFKRIRSFHHIGGPPLTKIAPNTLFIDAPICQVNNIGINFLNVNYYTNFESPSLVFGSVTTYEYLLPSGWSVNGQTSNGTTWIAGGNNVTVTSDLVNGDQGCVKIRKVNPCGASLKKGEETCISISRPLNLGISGQASLCSDDTYLITGLPANSSVTSWVSSNPATASVPNPSAGTSVLLTKVGNGRITLTANVQLCDGSQRSVIKEIQVGAAAFGNYTFRSNSSTGTVALGQSNSHLIPKNQQMCFTPTIANQDLTNPVWTYTSGTYPYFTTNGMALNFCLTAPSTGYASNSTTFTFTASNSCGSFSTPYTFTVVAQGWSFRFATYPNPSKGDIMLSLLDAEDYLKSLNVNEPIIIEVMAMNSGRMMKQYRNVIVKKQFKLNLSDLSTGVYLIRVRIKDQVQTQQITIAK